MTNDSLKKFTNIKRETRGVINIDPLQFISNFNLKNSSMLASVHMVKIIKSITAKQIYKQHPEVKKFLWGGNIWTSGYYINTVGQYGDLKMIQNYVKTQGIPHYTQLHTQQISLFTEL